MGAIVKRRRTGQEVTAEIPAAMRVDLYQKPGPRSAGQHAGVLAHRLRPFDGVIGI
jgi:hypothetical protein